MEWNHASPAGAANSRNIPVARPPEEEGLLSLCGDIPPAGPPPSSQAEGPAALRLLHAAADEGPLQAADGSHALASGLSFGNATGFFPVAGGRHTITLHSAVRSGAPLLRETVRLTPGGAATLAVVRSGSGLALVRLDDPPSGSAPPDCACLRAVNLVHGAPALDIALSGGPDIFSGVRFGAATPWRRARPKAYEYCAALAGPEDRKSVV